MWCLTAFSDILTDILPSFLLVCFRERGLLYPWLISNSLCSQGWPWTFWSSCLCLLSARTIGTHYHVSFVWPWRLTLVPSACRTSPLLIKHIPGSPSWLGVTGDFYKPLLILKWYSTDARMECRTTAGYWTGGGAKDAECVQRIRRGGEGSELPNGTEWALRAAGEVCKGPRWAVSSHHTQEGRGEKHFDFSHTRAPVRPTDSLIAWTKGVQTPFPAFSTWALRSFPCSFEHVIWF